MYKYEVYKKIAGILHKLYFWINLPGFLEHCQKFCWKKIKLSIFSRGDVKSQIFKNNTSNDRYTCKVSFKKNFCEDVKSQIFINSTSNER